MKQTISLLFILCVFSCPAFSQADTSHRSVKTSTAKPHSNYFQSPDYHNDFRLSFGTPLNVPKCNIKSDIQFAFSYEKRFSRFGIAPIISVGEFNGYDETYLAATTGTVFIVGLRFNYFLIQNSRLELYAGIMAGVLACDNIYLTRNYTSNGTSYGYTSYGYEGGTLASDAEGFKFGIHVGAHLWLTHHFGLMSELGSGTSLFNFGILLRH